jgi:succinyl-diaminopimelate desuccinylase
MDKREKNALGHMDMNRLIQLARQLIQIPSINPPGEYGDISALLHDEMNSIGLKTALLEGGSGRPNILGMLSGSELRGPVLMLSGHTDVVSPGDPSSWKWPPFAGSISDDKIWGRGAVDMKGALAASVMAMDAVVRAGVKLKGTVMMGATVDDETAGPWGMKYVLEKGLQSLGWPLPSFHVLGEANNLNITGAFKGRFWAKISVRGKQAHGGEPHAGVNAIEKMIKLLSETRTLCRLRHPLMGRDTLNIGKIQGGEVVNVVPARCTAHIDFRMCSPDQAEEAVKRLRNIIRGLEEEDTEFRLDELEVYELRDPVEVASNHPLVKTIAGCVESVTGRAAAFEGSLSAGDLYHSLKRGIPGVWIGAGDGSLRHAANECIAIKDLVNMARVYVLLILRVCA